MIHIKKLSNRQVRGGPYVIVALAARSPIVLEPRLAREHATDSFSLDLNLVYQLQRLDEGLPFSRFKKLEWTLCCNSL